MTWWEALVLGVVQGVTEFFPVSSSGHLVIGQQLLGLAVPGILFDVAVHVATLISVLVVYRERVFGLLRGALARDRNAGAYLLKILIASIPAGIVGVVFQDWFEARFDDAVFASTMLLVTGCIVWSSRWALADRRPRPVEFVPIAVAAVFALLAGTVLPFLLVLVLMAAILAASRFTAPRAEHAEPTWGGALVIGIAQAAAILPGISRSGSTVLTGLWRRVTPTGAAEFSFLMSIPAILGAALLQAPEALRAEEMGVSAFAMAAGFLGAAITGVLAIRFFVALLKRQNFHVFAYYCWAAAGVFLFIFTRGG